MQNPPISRSKTPISNKIFRYLVMKKGVPFTYQSLAKYMYRSKSPQACNRARSLFNIFRSRHPELQIVMNRGKLTDLPGAPVALITYLGGAHDLQEEEVLPKQTRMERPNASPQATSKRYVPTPCPKLHIDQFTLPAGTVITYTKERKKAQ